jgi:hypothetical protein
LLKSAAKQTEDELSPSAFEIVAELTNLFAQPCDTVSDSSSNACLSNIPHHFCGSGGKQPISFDNTKQDILAFNVS